MSVEIGLLPVLHALLGSVRVIVVMLAGPVFSHPALPVRVRLMASVMIAWAASPQGVGAIADQQWDVPSVAAAVGVEVLIGLAIGIGSGLVFAGFLQLGEFLAIQGGLGAARSIDPSSGASSVAIGSALNTFAMLIFLLIGGHRELILGLAASFEALPVGGALPDGAIFLEVARLAAVIWEIAFKLAAPVTVAIFVQNVATGVLGRAMPQLNLLIVNLPLHVGMMLLILGLGASDYTHVIKDALEVWPTRVFAVVLGGDLGG
jgi:flagellar biosynthetic protein FliR